VIPAGDEIDTRGEHFVRRLLGQAESARGVLAIRDDRVDVMLFACEGQMFLQRFPARRSDDVADDEQGNSWLYDRALALAPLPE
jgi:hypothetical protein